MVDVKKIRKMVAAVLSLLMVVSIVPMSAFASSSSNGVDELAESISVEAQEFSSRVDSFTEEYGSIASIAALSEAEKAKIRSHFEASFPEIVNTERRIADASQSFSRVNYTLYMYEIYPTGYMLVMDKGGYDVVKSIIGIGSGAGAIGLAIASQCGWVLAGPVAAVVGGYVAINIGIIELQFALGYPYASIAIPV